MPLISVVIPTFNRAPLLRRAITSVLAQRGADFELVISDNCSTDDTSAVATEFTGDPRVRYSRREHNVGMVGNWRYGIFELAAADWFILMSDDDFFTDSNYLALASEAIRRHDPAFVYAGGEVLDSASGLTAVFVPPFRGLVDGAAVFASRGSVSPLDAILCNMVFRRSDAGRLGFPGDPDNLSCDSELYLQLCSEGSVYCIPEPVCTYVKHGKNIVDTIQKSRRLLDYNLDHLVVPYVYAIERGMDPASIDAFRKHARLEHSIGLTLLKLGLHRRQWYEECRDRLRRLVPLLIDRIESSTGFRLKRLVLAVGRSYFRRRYPLKD